MQHTLLSTQMQWVRDAVNSKQAVNQAQHTCMRTHRFCWFGDSLNWHPSPFCTKAKAWVNVLLVTWSINNECHWCSRYSIPRMAVQRIPFAWVSAQLLSTCIFKSVCLDLWRLHVHWCRRNPLNNIKTARALMLWECVIGFSTQSIKSSHAQPVKG